MFLFVRLVGQTFKIERLAWKIRDTCSGWFPVGGLKRRGRGSRVKAKGGNMGTKKRAGGLAPSVHNLQCLASHAHTYQLPHTLLGPTGAPSNSFCLLPTGLLLNFQFSHIWLLENRAPFFFELTIVLPFSGRHIAVWGFCQPSPPSSSVSARDKDIDSLGNKR